MRVDPVEVFCRVRPLADSSSENNQSSENGCIKILDEFNLLLNIPQVISTNDSKKQANNFNFIIFHYLKTSASYRSGQVKQVYVYNLKL